jgi:site-specific recombinase XerC
MDGVAGVRAGSVVRMLFDYLVASGILAHNPVLSVRAPRQSVANLPDLTLSHVRGQARIC